MHLNQVGGWAAVLLTGIAVSLPGTQTGAEELPTWGCPGTGHALLTVVVPEGAKVFVNDLPTRSTGSRRQYLSLGLLPGRVYPYHVRAEVTRDGRTEPRSKLVYLRAGERAEISLGVEAARPTPPATLLTRLTVRVPEDARLYLDGRGVAGSGTVRRFRTMAMRRGETRPDYTIGAVVERSGRTLTKQETITLVAGRLHEVSFDFGDLDRPLLATRDPQARQQVVRREGGGPQTESAVGRGLQWLARRQLPDGRWSLQTSLFEGDPSEPVSEISDVGATGLALLAFLGAGQTHVGGQYQRQVRKGLDWLIRQEKPDGDLRGNSTEKSAMYAQALATIVLCESLAMTGQEVLRGPAQKAVDFIVRAQHAGGGWRYRPGQPGDTSVLGWQLMALHSAKSAGLKVPQATLDAASRFLDGVQEMGGSRYRYQPGRAPSHVMTAEGLLCRIYLGWKRDDPRLAEGVAYIAESYPPDKDQPDVYYWYYATQLLYQIGGDPWDKWNRQMRKILVDSQETEGVQAGSWVPRGERAEEGGRLYMTTLAICMLEVYYRYAPIFRQIQRE